MIMNNRTTLSKINAYKKEDNVKYLTYKYTYRNLHNIIKNTKMDKHKYKYAYKPNKSIYNIIKNKDECDIYNLSGIYKIKCNDCDHIYIGRTYRNFRQRFMEHFKAFTNKKTKISNVADHLINMNHSITDINNNMEIVEINNNKNDIIQLEKLYIYLHKKNYKLMNQQTIFENDELFRYLSNIVSTNNDVSGKFNMEDRRYNSVHSY